MIPLSLLLSQLLLLLSGSVAFQSRDLNRMADYISEREGPDGIIWELSLSDEPVENISRVYLTGDTLYSETLGGTRRWYQLKNDTLFHTREETLTEAMNVIPVVPSCALGDERHTSETAYRADGASSASVRIIREGHHYGMPGKKGSMTISNGDTIRATMTTERFRYHESYSVSPPSGDETEGVPGDEEVKENPGKASTHDVEIRRWFTDSPLPFAVSLRHVYFGEDGAEAYSEEMTYVADSLFGGSSEGTEELPVEDLKDIVRNVLSEMTVNENGGLLRITLSTPCPLSLSLDIFTDGGIPCLHEDFVAEGTVSITFPCADIPAGRRLTVISGYGCRESRYVRFH